MTSVETGQLADAGDMMARVADGLMRIGYHDGEAMNWYQLRTAEKPKRQLSAIGRWRL
jgi:hypothetical protein